MTTPYALPPPIVTIVHGFTPEQMQQAFKDGAASRDAEIAHLKQELQIECASNAIKDTDTAALRADAARYQAPVAQIKDVDEYGPRLDWFKHWTTFPEGTKLYVHAQGDPV